MSPVHSCWFPHGFVALLCRSELWHSLSSLRLCKLKGILMVFAFNTSKWVTIMTTRNTLCANNDLCSNTAFELHWHVWIYYMYNIANDFFAILPPASPFNFSSPDREKWSGWSLESKNLWPVENEKKLVPGQRKFQLAASSLNRH